MIIEHARCVASPLDRVSPEFDSHTGRANGLWPQV